MLCAGPQNTPTLSIVQFFGKDGKDKLDFATFSKFVDALQEMMLRKDFMSYTRDSKDPEMICKVG